MEMISPEGKREYFYDMSGRLVMEKLNGEIDVEYTYGYLDKIIEVDRKGKKTKFAYDGFGMLAQKTFADGRTEVWVWDGLALIRRGSDIYFNEPHISGGVPVASKTEDGIRYHEHDFLETTHWSMDTKGKVVKDYQDTTIFGEDGSAASIEGATPLTATRYAHYTYPRQHNRSARFTVKPYDEDLQAYVFPYRNYDATTARWRSSDPAGYPDGINNQFYAAVPTLGLDVSGVWIVGTTIIFSSPNTTYYHDGNNNINVYVNAEIRVNITKESTDRDAVLMYDRIVQIGTGSQTRDSNRLTEGTNFLNVENLGFLINPNQISDGLKRANIEINVLANDGKTNILLNKTKKESVWNLLN